MAFKLQYPLSGLNYTLTGVVGQDGKVYWMTGDIATLLGRKRMYEFSRKRSYRQVRDVIGNVSLGPFQRRWVVDTREFIQILGAKNIFQNLANLLTDQESTIKVLSENSLTNVQTPTKVTMCSSQESASMPWFLWLEFFKNKALQNLYGRNVDMALNFAKISASYQTPLEAMPETLSLKWKDKALSFVQYTGKEPTVPVQENQPEQLFLLYKGRIIPYLNATKRII